MSIIKRLFSRKKKLDKEYSELIFRLYYNPAYEAAYFYCGDAAIAEEAAQEAIFKAIQNIDQLRDSDKIEAWVKKIAINNATDLLNKNKKVVSIELVAPILDSQENSPEYIMNSQETFEAVRGIVESLDPAMKQIIHLYYYQEMKVKDIADLLQKPEGTIKTLLYRARNSIRSKLFKEGHIENNPKGGLKVE